VLAADDSAVMRGVLRTVFEMHAGNKQSALPRMELCGLVRDGVEALEAVSRLKPDVLLLDLEMPRMGGLDVLDRLRKEAPALPVIMCSAHTERGASATLDALSRGAKDYVMKPTQQSDLKLALETLSHQLLPKIAALANAAWLALPQRRPAGMENTQSTTSVEALRRVLGTVLPLHPGRPDARPEGTKIALVVIGVSTGGPAALEAMLPMLPPNLPVPVMIVQHMPKLFTGALADRLHKLCQMPVLEARDGMRVNPGNIYIAPGDAHMEIARAVFGGEAGAAEVRLHQSVPLHSCKPAADYLFLSAARLYGAGTLAVVLTGMGSDGLDGSKSVRAAGGVVLAQDEATSAVWGMPGRVSREGVAHQTLPLRNIANAIRQRVEPTTDLTNPTLSLSGLDVRREIRHGLL
jgi:two-component system chemotaxis response regulator CheB